MAILLKIKKPFVYSWNEDVGRIKKEEELPKFSPSELIGRTFLMDMENGERVKAQVMRKLNDWDAHNHQNIKFLLKLLIKMWKKS